ncbi:MAG TPA: alpha/beta fold hydrolase [Candidatus Sulfotelmatobacter sp.]|nr:alpha/beta fold hydrolase [Candidatus Sulfotelmatobacter sp.]
MTAPANPPRPGRLRRFGLVLVGCVVLLALAGFIYENIAETRDVRFNPMPGTRVNISGAGQSPLYLHIYCIGDGVPTVILDSGLGDSYVSWHKVQPEIAKFVRVCSYDRAGIGFSDSSPRPRTSRVIAEELNRLLRAAPVAPPYVLVGHSMGGYDVRMYASLFPSEVAGMVLVDASHPDQEERLPAELRNFEGTWMRESEFLEYTMPFGIPRLMDLCNETPAVRAAECNFHTSREQIEEMRSFPTSATETRATGSLGDMPLIVLSHDPDKPSAEFSPDLAKPVNEAWEKMQEELAHLSTRGVQRIAKNSAHYVQSDRPEMVVDGVHEVVDQVRAKQAAASH